MIMTLLMRRLSQCPDIAPADDELRHSITNEIKHAKDAIKRRQKGSRQI